MKMYFRFFTLSLLVGFLVVSCSEEEEPMLAPPSITHFEYGAGTTHSTIPVGYKGSDLHLAADIEADAAIREIVLSIHSHDATPSEEEVEWDFERIYNDAKYQVMNPEFHEHIDIPENIPSGEYHISLSVEDELGNTTNHESELQIVDPILFSDIDVPSSANRGDDFHAEFKVTAIHGIHSISVDIHAHGLTPQEGEVVWDHEEEFSEGYHGETEAVFHEHIEIPNTAPAGEYHVLFTVEDEKGNAQKFDTHVEIIKN